MRPWELTDLRSRKASSTQNRVGVNRMRDCLRVAALSTICERGIGGRKRGRAIFWCEEMGERDERFFGCGCGHPHFSPASSGSRRCRQTIHSQVGRRGGSVWRERAREGAVVRALDKGRRGGERVWRARARARAASGASTVPPPFLLFFPPPSSPSLPTTHPAVDFRHGEALGRVGGRQAGRRLDGRLRGLGGGGAGEGGQAEEEGGRRHAKTAVAAAGGGGRTGDAHSGGFWELPSFVGVRGCFRRGDAAGLPAERRACLESSEMVDGGEEEVRGYVGRLMAGARAASLTTSGVCASPLLLPAGALPRALASHKATAPKQAAPHDLRLACQECGGREEGGRAGRAPRPNIDKKLPER